MSDTEIGRPQAAPPRPARRWNRRSVLKFGAAGVGVAVVGAGAGAGAGFGTMYANADINTADRVAFTRRLVIPPLATGRLDAAGRRVFDLRAQAGSRQFKPGRATATWGINGAYLAPTLRAARGDLVLARVHNSLPEATTLHWHGMHLPAAVDGGPHQPIEPGATWTPSWRIDQPAATLWYHPHPHNRTAHHLYRGISGLFLIDDPDATPSGLPNRYGVDDVPVIVQDKLFDAANQLGEQREANTDVGILGDTIVVNGTLAPYHDVTTERVRLRVLNASNARIYRFGMADERPIALIGTDGGLLAEPYITTHVQLSPAERAEIVVTLRPAERVALRSYPPKLPGVNFWDHRFGGGADTFDILELRAATELAPSPPLPDVLADSPVIDISTVAATRDFLMSGYEINGKTMDMGRIDVASTVDTTEIWQVRAVDAVPHNFHVHDVQFQVLSIDGAAPPPELRGWKDTVFVPPDRSVRIAMHFRDYADRNLPYMYHCHLLYHEDRGLMGQFVVLDQGQQAGIPPTHSHPAHR